MHALRVRDILFVARFWFLISGIATHHFRLAESRPRLAATLLLSCPDLHRQLEKAPT